MEFINVLVPPPYIVRKNGEPIQRNGQYAKGCQECPLKHECFVRRGEHIGLMEMLVCHASTSLRQFYDVLSQHTKNTGVFRALGRTNEIRLGFGLHLDPTEGNLFIPLTIGDGGVANTSVDIRDYNYYLSYPPIRTVDILFTGTSLGGIRYNLILIPARTHVIFGCSHFNPEIRNYDIHSRTAYKVNRDL